MNALGRLVARGRGQEHSIVSLVQALVLFESMLYAVVTPVLPHYADTLGASKPAIGVLVAAYPAGMVPGTVLGGWIATRFGVRRTTVVGLSMFAVSITVFGFASNIVALDALRFVQGAACGCLWSGGLTWVIAVAPRERRGEMLGTVIAAAIFGTILGPVMGTLAAAVGTEIVFSALGLVAVGLAAWTFRHPAPPQFDTDEGTPVRALTSSPRVLLGAWLILLEACTIGALGTLLPLRLSDLGASGIAIGATFVFASVVSTVIAPMIGRLTDRRGPGLPLCVGLVTATPLLLALPLPESVLALAVLSVITLGGPLTAYTIPAMAVITDSAERLGITLVLSSMLFNIAWAIGEMIGAPAAASISQATSDAVPLALLAAINLATLVSVIAIGLGPTADVTETKPIAVAADPDWPLTRPTP
ncbi:MAG TPA: MFS transporter [Solirubrobacteraceae bacterium]|nr:MFS transporter [Solirubrobacteraceae bacterium]